MTLFNNIYIVLGILHGQLMAERHLTHQGDGDDYIYIHAHDNFGQGTQIKANGNSGNDSLNINLDSSYGKDSATINADGGTGNDTIRVTGRYNRVGTNIDIRGGAGNDNITVSESSAGRYDQATSDYGFSNVVIDAGADDDTITIEGSLNTSITTGAGSDTIRLTAHQFRTQQQGDRRVFEANSNNWRFTNDKVNAEPITVTDFTTGEGGDILDYSDLLKSASVNYNGENPLLHWTHQARSVWERHSFPVRC